MNEQRNLILAIVLTAVILFGFQWLFPQQRQASAPAEQTTSAAAPGGAPAAQPGVSASPTAAQQAAGMVQSRADALGKSGRLEIRTPKLSGSIALTGGRIDDLTLLDYKAEPTADAPHITLLSPSMAPEPYFSQFGWVASVGSSVKVPDDSTIWTPAPGTSELGAGGAVVLSWDNGDGLRFVRTISVDQNYMFQVTDRVENYGNQPVSLHPYALVKRVGTPHTQGMYILHEGPLGVLDGSLKEIKYDDLKKKSEDHVKTTGGWIGITDKYWLTAIIPDQKAEMTGHFTHHREANNDAYQVDFTGGPVTVAAGAAGESSFHLFAGAKMVTLLDSYGESLGINRFDLAIDFGWFYFLTKPFFYLLQMLHHALGNMGLAILALTVLLKLAVFPLANKSYTSMSRMKKLQPEVKKLQERFAEDKVRMQQEMMALYKREKVNPVSGCLPILVQIPIFFALYKVLFVTIEMRHAPFYGWIHDLSAPDPTTVFNLFGVIPWDPPSFLHLGVWPLIMGVTMWLQQKLNPAPADPVQAKMMMFLPIVFTFLLGNFAAGLVIYWAWSNTLSILQQWVIMRRLGVKS